MADSFQIPILGSQDRKDPTTSDAPPIPQNSPDNATQANPRLQITVEFKLGFQPEELKEQDLIPLKQLRNRVTIVQHAPTKVVMARRAVRVQAEGFVRKQIIREMRVMHDCHSEYILDFYGAFSDGDSTDVLMFTEYMDIGSLQSVIKHGPISVDILGEVAIAVLGGLTYLYTNHRIIHRDLKPSNILVNSRGQFKLRGFGASSKLMNLVTETFIGTITFMAPERIKGLEYSVKSDVWSVGITLLQLATEKFPFRRAQNGDEDPPSSTLELYQYIVKEPSPTLPADGSFPQTLRVMIDKCLMKEANDRPTPQELYDSDPFILEAKHAKVDVGGWATNLPIPSKLDDGQNNAPAPLKSGTEPSQGPTKLEVSSTEDSIATDSLLLHLGRMTLAEGLDHGKKPQETLLCTRCQILVRNFDTTTLDKQEIDEGRARKCSLCQIILDCLPSGIAHRVTSTELPDRTEDTIHLVLKVGSQYGLMDNAMNTGSQLEDTTTRSDSSFQMAAAWMKSCLTMHSKCIGAANITLPVLPTRVIDVGATEETGDVRLYLGDGQRGLYFTLSYRWSQNKYAAFETTTSNLDSYQNSISTDKLPQTMQDAILITRRFGIRYIWIDALCIVQNSAADWISEAQKMATIYKNSLLTIAAATDGDAWTEGCFQPRKRMQTRPLMIEPGSVDTPAKYIFADRRLTRDGIRPRSTLDTRAWVLQEQLLSARVLTYSNGELYWDCRSANSSETFPNGIPGFYDADFRLPGERLFKEAILSTSKASVNHSRFYNAWKKIVEAYSERQMTKDTDKLSALLGLINEGSAIFNDIYLAGLWKKKLWSELLWRVRTPEKATRLTFFTAPTWSWASLNAPILYDLGGYDSVETFQICAKVMGYEVSRSQTNESHVLLSGHITFLGKLVRLRGQSPTKGNELSSSIQNPDQQMPLPKWMEDISGTDPLSVRCVIIAASYHYVYAIGVVEVYGEEIQYKRVGLVQWRASPELFGWNCTKSKWNNENDLVVVKIV